MLQERSSPAWKLSHLHNSNNDVLHRPDHPDRPGSALWFPCLRSPCKYRILAYAGTGLCQILMPSKPVRNSSRWKGCSNTEAHLSEFQW